MLLICKSFHLGIELDHHIKAKALVALFDMSLESRKALDLRLVESIEELEAKIKSAEMYVADLDARASRATANFLDEKKTINQSNVNQCLMSQIEGQKENMLANIVRWKTQLDEMKREGHTGLYVQSVPTELGTLLQGENAVPLIKVVSRRM